MNKMVRNSVGNKSIHSCKSGLDMRGKIYGWTTRWVRKGVSFNVLDMNGNIIARHGL